MKNIIRALRPSHWIKNIVVLAAYIFAMGDSEQAGLMTSSSIFYAIGATVLFCVISSAVYIMNDIADIKLDREHPIKRYRPIASGAVSIPLAGFMSFALMSAGLASSYFLSPSLALVLVSYVALQVSYSMVFKRVAMLDVFVIAIGFVLRALAGAVVLDVLISPWLILCTFLLALFLGYCKRRHERVQLENDIQENRPSLVQYDTKLLDQIIAILSATTIVSYALYTLSPDTIRKFGSAELGFSIPFVMFGVFRYLDLVYRHDKGNKPERILLTDLPLLVDILLYALTILFLFSRH